MYIRSENCISFIVYINWLFYIFCNLSCPLGQKYIENHFISNPGIPGDDGDNGQGTQRAAVRGHDQDRVPCCGSLHATHGRQCSHAERGRVSEGFPVGGSGAGHGVA